MMQMTIGQSRNCPVADKYIGSCFHRTQTVDRTLHHRIDAAAQRRPGVLGDAHKPAFALRELDFRHDTFKVPAFFGLGLDGG